MTLDVDLLTHKSVSMLCDKILRSTIQDIVFNNDRDARTNEQTRNITSPRQRHKLEILEFAKHTNVSIGVYNLLFE